MSSTTKTRPSRQEQIESRRNVQVEGSQAILDQNTKQLKSFRELIEDVELPGPLAIALTTGRSEILRSAQPEPLDAESVGKLYKAIAVLVETNHALRQHAAEVSALAEQWNELFKGVARQGRKVAAFASFKNPYVEEDVEG